ncbi:MAG: hypothetical protein EXS05_03945 [Planctomycetaceae bacterium]|nr:hypothetical protein [Planctomycetaceae bacterium]
MPKPVYIIASESGSEDRRGNVLSLFRILEKFTIKIPDQSIRPQVAADMAGQTQVKNVEASQADQFSQDNPDSPMEFPAEHFGF